MLQIKTIALVLLSLNLATIAFLGFSYYKHEKINRQLYTQGEEVPVDGVYYFSEPDIALKLLEKLDIFSVVEDGEIPSAYYRGSNKGFTVNFNYCNEHRSRIVNHPEIVFAQKNIISDYWLTNKMRSQIIPKFGAVDLHPEVHPHAKKDQAKYEYEMNPDANIFYMLNLAFYSKQIGKQYSCLTQASNHIPGHEKVYRKDHAAQALVEYARTYADRPTCFNFDRFFPKTWVLSQRDQCKEFFDEFNSPRYQQLKQERGVVYFRKIGANVHLGKGVFPVGQSEETYLRRLYQNGTACGRISDNNLIQYNIYNPLLIDNRKFHFRTYMLVASTNPVIAYYHDGYLRLSLSEYDSGSSDLNTFVTNYGVSNPKHKSMSYKEIQEYTSWLFKRFEAYLLEQGKVQDPDWLNNYLRPQFKKVMAHLMRMAGGGFFTKSSLFELYGVDFIMDENLDVWFIEANAMPLIHGFTQETTDLINQVLTDTLEIVTGLLRSRMKRIVIYINALTKTAALEGGMDKLDIEEKRMEFRELTKNKFELEYFPSRTNGFERVVDENYNGTKRYFGLFDGKCL